ncbi:MAG: hypothetical protein R3E39_26190, partial [Anaerolineae bacterium]
MGYAGHYIFKNVVIPTENIQLSLDAINALYEPALMEKQALGGRHDFRTGTMVERWYAGVETPPNRKHKTLLEALDAWAFRSQTTNNGIEIIEYLFPTLGQEDLLFDAIAPFVQQGAVIRGFGEGGAAWEIHFTSKGSI